MNDEEFHRSRRMFLRTSGLIAIALVGAARAPLVRAQANTAGSPMKIGVVGSGKLGGSVGGRWVKAGHEVFFSSRHPEELKGLVDSLGSRARAGSVKDAIGFASVVFIAVPYAALPDIGRENAVGLAGKIVIDACNPIASRDGDIVKEAMANGIGPTSMKYLPGTRLVRAFNPVGYRNFEGDPQTSPSVDRIGMPVAGDDPDAVKVASQLVRDAGLEPVIVPLARAMDFAPGTALFGKAIPVAELRKQLGVAQ
jgi:8-hydroxy-5-deazaflavin:NADPH oxidoreductase